MPPANYNHDKNSLRRLRLAFLISSLLVLALLFAFVGLGTATARDEGVTFGSRVITLKLDDKDSQDEWFSNLSWDGPTGEFSSGRILAMRLPWGVLKLEIEHDPVGAIRKRLPTSVSALAKLLTSRNQIEVYCAAEALEEQQAAAISALPELLAAAERNANISSALETIARASPAQSVPLLTSALSSTNAHLQEQCAAILGLIGTNATPAAPALLAGFRIASPKLQPALASALWKITGECSATLPALRKILRNSADPDLKMSAVYILAQMGEKAAPAIPELLAVLNSNLDPHLRNSALSALAEIGQAPERVLPALISVLETTTKKPNPLYGRVPRNLAIQSLGKYGAAGVPHLIPLYEGTNNQDKLLAAKSLAKIGPPAAEFLDLYQAELKSAHSGRVLLACEIIGSLGPKAGPAFPTLGELLFAPDKKVRIHSAAALARLGHNLNLAILVLVDVLGEPSGTSIGNRYSEDELALATLNQILQASSDLKPVLDRALKSNPTATRYLQIRRTMAKLYGLPSYPLLGPLDGS